MRNDETQNNNNNHNQNKNNIILYIYIFVSLSLSIYIYTYEFNARHLKKYDKYESSYGRGVARIVRVVRFFNDLRVMVNGIKASSRALLWAVAPRHIKIVV